MRSECAKVKACRLWQQWISVKAALNDCITWNGSDFPSVVGWKEQGFKAPMFQGDNVCSSKREQLQLCGGFSCAECHLKGTKKKKEAILHPIGAPSGSQTATQASGMHNDGVFPSRIE